MSWLVYFHYLHTLGSRYNHLGLLVGSESTIFLWWDTAATIRGPRLFLRKARRHQRWLDKIHTMKYIQMRWWQLLDTVSSTHSLLVQLLAVETTYTTWIALVLAWWPWSEIIRTRVCVPIIAAATIQAQCLFRSELPIVQQLFEGMQRLFEEIWYAKFS